MNQARPGISQHSYQKQNKCRFLRAGSYNMPAVGESHYQIKYSGENHVLMKMNRIKYLQHDVVDYCTKGGANRK